MKTFEEYYSRLNLAQRLAVDTVEGPVMVVAGPGTGKTQVVAMRVANILKKTQARPNNVLCLTFSVSGATAMRERLRSLIGPDAYRVNVNTIHGFCNDIIGSHPHVFEQWSAFAQISDVDRYRVVNEIIESMLPNLELVNKKNPLRRTKEILSRISLLKREGKSDYAELDRTAEEFGQVQSGKSKPGTKIHAANVASARKFKELIEIFKRYQAALERSGRYDYDDMILTVIKALKEEDWLLASLQERYQYLLVDEFQDTNGAQYEVIKLLTTPRTPDDKPNLFIVGDDDQAIYRFQGANLKNILSFRERFPDAPVIALTISYRCTQAILDAAGTLISYNTERLVGKISGLDKTLKSGKGDAGNSPRLFLSPSDVSEPWMIADIIDERIVAGTLASQIAVLTQTNAELRPLYEVLRARSIPVQMSGTVNLLENASIMQLLSILSAIRNPHDASALAGALACDCFGCHPSDLGRLFERRREQHAPLLQILLEIGESKTSDPFPILKRAALVAARDRILALHQKVPSRTLADTVLYALKECELLVVPVRLRGAQRAELAGGSVQRGSGFLSGVA